MSKEINLLKLNNNSNSLDFLLIFRILSYGFFGFAIIFGIIFLYLGNTTNPSFVTAQENFIQAQIKKQSSKIGTLLFIKDRINKINAILKDRNSFDTDLSIIVSGIPTNVNIDELSIDKKIVSLSFSSQSLSDISTVSNFLTSLYNQKKIFSQITINSVILDSTSGKYILSISGQIF